MAEGQLKVPPGNNYLRKRTVVLTTSKEFHILLDARYCRKGHEHRPILGQAYINGRWQNLSAFAAKYSKGFAKNVAYAIATSKQLGEYPVTLEELLVPCFGVRSAEQQEMAEQIVKRRKYSHKQGPRPGEEEGPAIPSNLRYGPASTWRSIFKTVGLQAPRVGTVVVDPGSVLFQQVAQQVNQFRTLHVEICRGTDRYRPPKAGIDISPLKYRLTVILNRESGEVEILGNPEEWKTLSKRRQIRRAKPARVCITIFGDDGAENIPLGKNLAEGDGKSGNVDKSPAMVPSGIVAEPDMDQMKPMEEHDESIEKPENLIVGHPPKNIPTHGPRFLSLSREDQQWLRSTHHKMGHPDPEKFARFLKSTHASPDIIAGSLDFQCDACVESHKGFQATRQAAIHEDIGFNQVVGMDMAFWTGSKGMRYGFLHDVDEGTLFQQAMPCQESATAQFQAFQNCWLTWAGPPKEMYFDPASEYVSDEFLTRLQEEGIQARVTARDSHWQLGRTEVHGSILKRMLDRMDVENPVDSPEQFYQCLVQAVCAKNSLSRVKGYTPEQAVLGISRRLPASISSDTSQASHALAEGESIESERFRAALDRRSLARKAFIEADNCNSLRRALSEKNQTNSRAI